MLIYDLGRMAKRLLPVYGVIIVFKLIFGRSASFYIPLLALGFFVTIFTNFRMFCKDYIGKDRILINMLPVRPGVKILTKLVTGCMFLGSFFFLFMYVSFAGIPIYTPFYAYTYGVVFFLSGYAAMSITKTSGKWYHILGGVILLNAICIVISAVVNLLAGYSCVLISHIIMCIVLIFICGHNIEK